MVKTNSTFEFFLSHIVKKKQLDVARALNVTPERVCEMKNGLKSNLSYATIERFCIAFGLDVIDFYLVHEAFKRENPIKFLTSNKGRFRDEDTVKTVLNVLENKC